MPRPKRTAASSSVRAGALLDKARLDGQGAKPYIISGRPWPPFEEIARKAQNLMDRIFDRAQPRVGEPTAVLTIGVMGSGKTTAIKQLRKRLGPSWKPALIDPDEIAIELLGRRELPAGGDLYDLASKWTHRIWEHAILGKYNIVYDAPVPSEHLMRRLRQKGYTIELLLVRASRVTARSREVRRDLDRGWGRPGVSERGHMSTAADISRNGPKLARYADRLTVCDNTGKVMKCVDRGDPAKVIDLQHEFRA